MELEINQKYNPIFIPELHLTSKQYKHIKEYDLITTDELGIEYFRGSKVNVIDSLPKLDDMIKESSYE